MEINRDHYLKQLINKKDNGRVKIITGIRRCGKSYLLFEILKKYLLSKDIAAEQIIEISLDDIEHVRYRDPFELNRYIKDRVANEDQRYYIFIDEIQFCAEVKNPYIPSDSEKVTFVDVLLGLQRKKNLDIYVTGSNSRMLSKDILTQFRDRGDEIHISPLSFKEFYEAYIKLHTGFSFPISFPFVSPMPEFEEIWKEYVTFGGMPYILSLDSIEEKSRYLKDLFEETYLKDIIDRNNIRRDRDVLDILLDFISSGIGSLTNPTKLANRFNSEIRGSEDRLSHSTVSKYLELLKDAYIIYEAKRYDVRGSEYFNSPLKYYFADTGLRNARLNFRQVEESHIMENIIFNELMIRGYNVDVGVIKTEGRVNGKRTTQQLEVDFVVNRGSVRCYIQSALHIDSPEKLEQETASLNKIRDSFKKIVIIKDSIVPHYNEKGIYFIGIKDFLLKDDSLNI